MQEEQENDETENHIRVLSSQAGCVLAAQAHRRRRSFGRLRPGVGTFVRPRLIEEMGCPASDCFCGGSNYWGYSYWDGNAWQGYPVGAGSSTLNDGAVEGWRWGAWGSAMWPAKPVTAALSAMGTDTNSTALAAAGEPLSSAVITNGLAYLKTAQNADGGFTYDPASAWGTDSDANSTAWILQALLATGQDPASADWTEGANTPISYLLSLQLPDGSFEWQAGQGTNQLATVQAIPALLGRSFPLRMAQPASCLTFSLPVIRR